jgi:protein SCO1/2
MLRRLAVALGITLLVGSLPVLSYLGYRQWTGQGVLPSLTPSIGGPFTLTDGDGKTVTDAMFRGKWMVVYFGYTHCPDACPTALSAIVTAIASLPAAQRALLQPIFITIDPDRDTGRVLRGYVTAFGPDLIGLTGNPTQLATVERAYRVYAEKAPTQGGSYEMNHSSFIYVMDPAGRYATNFSSDMSSDAIAAGLRKLVITK